jgi:hypothetical protein
VVVSPEKIRMITGCNRLPFGSFCHNTGQLTSIPAVCEAFLKVFLECTIMKFLSYPWKD